MESISRYHLAKHEDGLWLAIDTDTGEPVEMVIDDETVILSEMPRHLAEEWSRRLNAPLGSQYRRKPFSVQCSGLPEPLSQRCVVPGLNKPWS